MMHVSDFKSDIRDYLICSGRNPDDFDIEGAAIRLFSRYSVDLEYLIEDEARKKDGSEND